MQYPGLTVIGYCICGLGCVSGVAWSDLPYWGLIYAFLAQSGGVFVRWQVVLRFLGGFWPPRVVISRADQALLRGIAALQALFYGLSRQVRRSRTLTIPVGELADTQFG
jgi:hypothetical protein